MNMIAGMDFHKNVNFLSIYLPITYEGSSVPEHFFSPNMNAEMWTAGRTECSRRKFQLFSRNEWKILNYELILQYFRTIL